MSQHYHLELSEENFEGHPTYYQLRIIPHNRTWHVSPLGISTAQQMYQWCIQQFGKEGDTWILQYSDAFMFVDRSMAMLCKLTWG